MEAPARRWSPLPSAAALLATCLLACGGAAPGASTTPADEGGRRSARETLEPRELAATDPEGRSFEIEGVEIIVRPDGDVLVGAEVVSRGPRLPYAAPWSVSEARAADLNGDGAEELLLILEAEASELDEDDGADSGVWSTSELHLNAMAFVVVDRVARRVSAEVVDLAYTLVGESSTEGATAEAVHLVCNGHGRTFGPSWHASCQRCEIMESLPRHPDAELDCETDFDRYRMTLAAPEASLSIEARDAGDSDCSCRTRSALMGH